MKKFRTFRSAVKALHYTKGGRRHYYEARELLYPLSAWNLRYKPGTPWVRRSQPVADAPFGWTIPLTDLDYVLFDEPN
jgi:hypothetical protein